MAATLDDAGDNYLLDGIASDGWCGLSLLLLSLPQLLWLESVPSDGDDDEDCGDGGVAVR
jgi:hypothetical protein